MSSWIGRLTCGEEQATAFAISPTILVTARHALEDHFESKRKIHVAFEGDPLEVELLPEQPPVDTDVVLLRVATRAEHGGGRLAVVHLPIGLTVNAAGHSAVKGRRALKMRVVHYDPTTNAPCDVELLVDSSSALSDYKGMSGAPLLTGREICGVMLQQFDGDLGAISLRRIRKALVSAGVVFRTELDAELPREIAEHVANSVPPIEFFQVLETSLVEHKTGYIVVDGEPGSGKTTAAALFTPHSNHHEIIGRYFIRLNKTTGLPASHFARVETFATWLSAQAALVTADAEVLGNSPTHDEYRRVIQTNLRALAAHTGSKSGAGILVLDDVPEDASFLEYLPATLPANLTLVMTVRNNSEFVAANSDLAVAQQLNLPPLDPVDCEFIAARILGADASIGLVLEIAERSQGNPLLLMLLTESARQAIEAAEEPKLGNLGTGLDSYYSNLWQSLEPDHHWLLGTLACCRASVSAVELSQIVPASQQVCFLAHLRRCRHLVSGSDDALSLFHESIREFVLKQMRTLVPALQTQLANYCKTASSKFGLCHRIHHSLKVPGVDGCAVELCSQEWLEEASARGGSPWLIVEDVSAALTSAVQQGILPETVRLLLLRSRAKHRLNLLVGGGADLSIAMLALHGPEAALDSALPSGGLTLDWESTASFMAELYRRGAESQIDLVFSKARRKFWSQIGKISLWALGSYVEVITYAATVNAERAAAELRKLQRVLDSEPPVTNALGGATLGTLLDIHGVFPANPPQLWGMGAELAAYLAHGLLRTRRSSRVATVFTEPDKQQPPVFMTPDSIARLMEEAVRQHGVVEGSERLVATALLNSLGCPGLVESLTPSAPGNDIDSGLRSENGVDANIVWFDHVMHWERIAAYTERPTVVLAAAKPRHDWEARFIETARTLASLAGSHALEVRRGTQSCSWLAKLTQRVLPKISFGLEERAGWEDSYHLPETILPFLLERALTFTRILEPESVSSVVEHLLEKTKVQMGIWAEGYQHSLLAVARELIKQPEADKASARLLNQLRSFVETCVFNRGERVAALLESASLLAQASKPKDCARAMREVLRSANGSSWYKEAQFGLIVSSLRSVADPSFTQEVLPSVVSTLELASGETTFQRFVRQQKEELIAVIARQGSTGVAVELYNYFCHPTRAVQLERAQRLRCDLLDGIRGLRFGVREIEEQSGVLSVLCSPNLDPLRVWALTELFWVGDSRYHEGFAKHALEAARLAGDVVTDRLRRTLCVDCDESQRSSFLDAMESFGNTAELREWCDGVSMLQGRWEKDSSLPHEVDSVGSSEATSSQLSAQPTPARSSPADSELSHPGVFGRKDGLKLLSGLSQDAGVDELVEALQLAQSTGWNIWRDEPGKAAVCRVFHQLGVREGLRALQSLVLSERYSLDWALAEALSSVTASSLDKGSLRGLFDIENAHLKSLLDPEQLYLRIRSTERVVDATQSKGIRLATRKGFASRDATTSGFAEV